MATARDSSSPTGDQERPVIVREDGGGTLVEYQIIRRIGEGNFGDVWRARVVGADGETTDVALKVLKGSADSDDTLREIKSLQALVGLNHRYLLKTYRYWIDGDRLIIEMELADGGSLKERLKFCKQAGQPGIPAGELLKYFREAAEGLDYLHTRTPERFLHRDIKPGNILLANGSAKLADFGLLRQVAGDKSHTHTTGGTQPYMAPESLVRNETSPHSDLFSLAVSYAQLRQGTLPFTGDLQFIIMKKITESAPELSDGVFGAAEKAVLQKALEKAPAARHRSCGEFVKALINAVPPEQRVYVPPHPSELGSGELDPTDATAAAGTIKPGSSRKKTHPQFRDPITGSNRPPRISESSKKEPKTTTGTAPPRRKSGAGGCLAVVSLFVLAAAFGGWFYQHQDKKNVVRQHIANKDFAKALASITAATPLWIPSPDELKDEVEEAWWDDLDPKGVRDEKKLKELHAGLDRFAKVFPNNPDIEARRKAIVLALAAKGDPGTASGLALNEIDQLLRDDKIAEAQTMRADKKDVLTPLDQLAIDEKISHKRAVRDVLRTAKDLSALGRFEETLAVLDTVKLHFDYPADKEKWGTILTGAKNGEHSRLVSAAEKALKNGPEPALADAKQNLAKFRAKYPDPGWTPSLEKYQTVADVGAVIERAWTALLADQIPNCLKAIAEIKSKAPPDPAGNRNVRVLTAFIDAQQAGAGERMVAATTLVKVVQADGRELVNFTPKMWEALAALESKSSLFTFDNADKLAQVMPVPAPEPAVRSRSKFIARVLERLVKQKGSWCPAADQCVSTCKLCEMIDARDHNDWLGALHAESWAETAAAGATPPETAKRLEKANFWYAAYAAAMVRHKSEPQKAADLILKAMEQGPKTIEPQKRIGRAIVLLREAVHSLDREGKYKKEFKNRPDAKKAQSWLTPVVALESAKPQLLVDLADLALSAGVLSDVNTLKTASDRISALLADEAFNTSDKEQAFYWLAKSYRALAPAESRVDDVFQFCDLALDVNKAGKSEWRRLAALEGAEFALTLGNDYLEAGISDQQKLDAAIAMSEKVRTYVTPLRGLAFEIAADRNREAFALLLDATRAKSTATDLKDVGVPFLAEVPGKLDAFHIPAVAHKLKYLPKVGYFEKKNEYLKKNVKNLYFEKAMSEARLALDAKQSAGASGEWWKKTRADLTVAMFDCLVGYADEGAKVINDEPGDFNKSYVDKLKPILDRYLEARRVKPDLAGNTKWHLGLKIGYTNVNLGHSYKADDIAKAMEYYRYGLDEFKKIPELFRERMPQEERTLLRNVEGGLEKVLKKSN